MLYQVGSRRNSSPTLEVGVFLLEKDKNEDCKPSPIPARPPTAHRNTLSF